MSRHCCKKKKKCCCQPELEPFPFNVGDIIYVSSEFVVTSIIRNPNDPNTFNFDFRTTKGITRDQWSMIRKA